MDRGAASRRCQRRASKRWGNGRQQQQQHESSARGETYSLEFSNCALTAMIVICALCCVELLVLLLVGGGKRRQGLGVGGGVVVLNDAAGGGRKSQVLVLSDRDGFRPRAGGEKWIPQRHELRFFPSFASAEGSRFIPVGDSMRQGQNGCVSQPAAAATPPRPQRNSDSLAVLAVTDGYSL